MARHFASLFLATLAASATFATASLANEPSLPRSEKPFQRVDMNKDGKITPDEMKPMAQKRLSRLDRDRDGKVTTAELDATLRERMEARKARMMERLDLDKDGTVTEAEMNTYVDGLFQTADTDHDGGVTLAEAQALRHSRKSAGPEAPRAN